MKICHVSSVHSRYDIRIYLKEIGSLRKAGYDVFFIVADGKGDESEKSILDIGLFKNKFSRIIFSRSKLYKKILEEKFDICHLHDPELMPLGLKLKRKGKTIFFDSHEDTSKQLLTKPYLNKFMRLFSSKVFKFYEKYALKKYHHVFTATESIKNTIEEINKNVTTINNYPLLNEVSKEARAVVEKRNEFCYTGGITEIRGIFELLRSLENIPHIRLNLAGRFDFNILYQKAIEIAGWKQVNYFGFVSRKKMLEIFNKSIAGVVNYYACPNHTEAQPNKIFEYMSAGLPVIISNFPLWRKLIESENCGICVDPMDPKAIADAVQKIYEDPSLGQSMGENGRQAVLKKYNWTMEEKKLLQIYKTVVEKR
ncbi:MAG: glycosyltransferase family 4 protein [Candidatus Neomarinimicrobiota bacterium]